MMLSSGRQVLRGLENPNHPVHKLLKATEDAVTGAWWMPRETLLTDPSRLRLSSDFKLPGGWIQRNIQSLLFRMDFLNWYSMEKHGQTLPSNRGPFGHRNSVDSAWPGQSPASPHECSQWFPEGMLSTKGQKNDYHTSWREWRIRTRKQLPQEEGVPLNAGPLTTDTETLPQWAAKQQWQRETQTPIYARL